MKLPQLTFTRFLAAILIVIYHQPSHTLHKLPFFGLLLQKIPALVSYFFLLSGFILVVSTTSGTALSKRQFWINRFARIYPLYLIAFLLTLLLASITQQADTSTVSRSMLTFFPEITLTHAWVSEWVPTLNYPGWSISVEAVFYFLFPTLFSWLAPKRTANIFVLAFLIWGLNQFLYVYCFDKGVPANICLYFPLLHLSTFICGVCTGILTMRHWQTLLSRQSVVVITCLFLLLLILTIYLVASGNPVLNYYHDGLLAPLFIVFILFLTVQQGLLARWLSRPTLIYLGEISYGIYLLQIPIGYALSYLNQRYLHLGPWQYVPVYLGSLLLISSVCYETIERPARFLLRRWLSPAINVKQLSSEQTVSV